MACLEYYKHELYNKLTDGTFKKVQFAHAWAESQFERFYPEHVHLFPAVKYFKPKGNKILKKRFPAQPTKDSLVHDNIPAHLSVTLHSGGQPFLLFKESYAHPPGPGHPHGGVETMVVFSSPDRFRALCEADSAFADGTFKVCPTPFYQLYIIHMSYGTRMRPAVFALLPRKTEETYNILFQKLHDLAEERGHPIAWTKFHCDYERATLNAVSFVFPLISLYGCFFHFCSALYKMALQLALGLLYRNPLLQVKMFIKLCMALAFLPPHLIPHTFGLVRAEAQLLNLPDLNRFFEYMYTSWIAGGVAPPAIWSVYGGDGRRTTNDCEGYHSMLNRTLGITKNFWLFLEKLQVEERKVHIDIQRLEAGQMPMQRLKYHRINDALERYKAMFEIGQLNPLMYIRSIVGLIPH